MRHVHDWGFAVLWLTYGLIWIARSASVNQTAQAEAPMSQFVHVAAVLAGIAQIFVPRRGLALFDIRLTPTGECPFLIGLSVGTTGLGFMVWARHHFGQCWSGTITQKESHRLIRTGHSRIVRHPIYTGFLLLVAGSAVSRGDVGGLLAVLVVLGANIRKIRIEETWLDGRFGEEYRRFRDEVGTIVPFLI